MRLVRSGPLPPALNLALDEALLRSGTETLRLYAWDPPGLSLGFFQRAAEFQPPPGYVLVRRPTGGGAIAHAGELTVAWIGRRRRVDEAYAAMNAVVAEALRTLGVQTAPGAGEPEAAPRGLCFDAHTRYDILARGRKVFGSAQRRARDRFLLHGSLVLRRNPLAQGAISVEEVTGAAPERDAAERAVVAAAERLWGVAFREEAPSAAEQADAERLVAERYSNPSWTRRR
jgi:lipoate-protein ligase A